ncbi:MAG TPA: hypothetical protein VK939_12205 [Longimicrobiales bacterium]|nr:hypothetical protein [Longimicrobiales bacterium]
MASTARDGSEVRLEEVHLMIRKDGRLYRLRLAAAEVEAAFAKRAAKGRYMDTLPQPPRVRLARLEDDAELVNEAESETRSAEGGEGAESGPVCVKMADCTIICWD